MPSAPVAKFVPREVTDALFAFPRGMNMGRAALLLPKNQLAYLENGTVRGDFVGPRPPYFTRPLSFAATTALTANLTPAEVQTAFTTGYFQFGCYFHDDFGNDSLMVAVSGHLYKITVVRDTFTVSDVTPTTTSGGNVVFDANPSTQPQAWLWQSERWCNWQDGISTPVFYDGLTSRRSKVTGQTLGTLADGVFDGMPAPGFECQVVLSSPFAGETGDLVTAVNPMGKKLGLFKVLPYSYQTDLNNATLTNTDGTGPTTFSVGDKIQRVTTTQVETVFASLAESHAKIGAEYGWLIKALTDSPCDLTAAFPGNIGDFIRIRGKDYSPGYPVDYDYTLKVSGKTNTLVYLHNPNPYDILLTTSKPPAFYYDASLYKVSYTKTVTTTTNLGVVVSGVVVAGMGTANIQLDPPYTGPANTAFTFGGSNASFTISPYSPKLVHKCHWTRRAFEQGNGCRQHTCLAGRESRCRNRSPRTFCHPVGNWRQGRLLAPV